jgi:hypothetical protein
VSDREWSLLNPGAGQGDIRTYAFRVSNMGALAPAAMPGVVDAFAASVAELRGTGGSR